MKIFTHDKNFYRMLISLALPVALQNLITFAVTFADNIMVSSLGDNAVSGVYVGSQIQTFLQMFSSGIEGAILILASQYWGKKDTASIKKIISVGMRFSISVGLLLTLICSLFPAFIISALARDNAVVADGVVYLKYVCFSYVFFCITQALIASMRSVELAGVGMLVSGVSLAVNVGLNYILIFGKLGFTPMGVKGAAIATLVSRIAECLIMIWYTFFFDKRLALKFKDFASTNKTLSHDFIKYGLPIVAGQIVWSINLMSSTAIMGRFPGEIMSAVSVANTMNSLAYITMNGMASAVGIITGKTIGEGKIDLMKEYARTVQVIFFVLGLLTGGFVALIKNPFIAFYKGISAGAAVYSRQFISVLSITIIGSCYQVACLFGLVKSGGDVSFVSKNDAIFVFLVVIPSALIALNLGAPAWVVFACLKCDQILKCIVAFFKINSYNWIKVLARDKDTSLET